ncbi:MAG: VTT domain-containing protein [Rhodospirillales bacterium]|nr:VTT domain-containing protein [Rhodospirillales bacterium]
MVKLFAIVLALVVFVSVPFFMFGTQIEQIFAGQGIITWMQGFGAYAWAAAIGLLVADLAIPVPTTAVMAALGMVYGPVLGGFYGAVGSVVSGLVGYGLCRKLGRPFALWLSGEKGLAEGERIFESLGGWIVAMSRWLPVVSEVVACMAGLSRMSFPVFFAALVCGSVPLGFLFSTIGYMGGDQPLLTLLLSALLPFGLWAMVRPFMAKIKGPR